MSTPIKFYAINPRNPESTIEWESIDDYITAGGDVMVLIDAAGNAGNLDLLEEIGRYLEEVTILSEERDEALRERAMAEHEARIKAKAYKPLSLSDKFGIVTMLLLPVIFILWAVQ